MPYILKAEQIESNLNKTLVVDENSTDKEYPSAKAVYDALTTAQPNKWYTRCIFD